MRQNKLRVTLLQTDITWMDMELNRKNAEKKKKKAPFSEIFILPEMWNTGFVTFKYDFCQDDVLTWMREMACKYDAALCGSLSVRDTCGDNYNRLYFVHPSGHVDFYDKRHLFGYGGEDKVYKAGGHRKVVCYKGLRFLTLTCYDLRFPVWSRNNDDYDAIIYVANWPESRQRVWDVLLRARAIENQSYVLGCNRVGNDPECSYAGGSVVVDSKGNVIAVAEGITPQIVYAELDFCKQQAFREKFPVLADRDLFELNH